MEFSHLFATWYMAYMIEYVTDFVLICNIQMYLCVLSHSEISESQVADGSENVCGTFFRDGPPPKATKVKSPVDLQVFHPQGIFSTKQESLFSCVCTVVRRSAGAEVFQKHG